MKPYLIEESCEALDAIDDEDMELAKTEMSDMVGLLFESLQIGFSSRSETENGIVLQCEVTVPVPQ